MQQHVKSNSSTLIENGLLTFASGKNKSPNNDPLNKNPSFSSLKIFKNDFSLPVLRSDCPRGSGAKNLHANFSKDLDRLLNF